MKSYLSDVFMHFSKGIWEKVGGKKMINMEEPKHVRKDANTHVHMYELFLAKCKHAYM
jgi:hypothetical protein